MASRLRVPTSSTSEWARLFVCLLVCLIARSFARPSAGQSTGRPAGRSVRPRIRPLDGRARRGTLAETIASVALIGTRLGHCELIY